MPRLPMFFHNCLQKNDLRPDAGGVDIPEDFVFIKDTDQLTTQRLASGAREGIVGVVNRGGVANTDWESTEILIAKVATGPRRA